MLRIFLTSSHLSTMLMTHYARKTHEAHHQDILLVDYFTKKRSLVKLILETTNLHNWYAVHDLSIPLNDDENLKPSTRKNLTRMLKTQPVFRSVYNFLFTLETKRATRKNSELLNRTWKLPAYDQVELNLLTETALNGALKNLFPKAQVNYFEHGVPDYSIVETMRQPNTRFYCVFAQAFQTFLKEQGKEHEFVHGYLESGEFESMSRQFLEKYSQKEELKQICQAGKKYALLLMQSMEVYNVKSNYWPDFMDLCLKSIGDYKELTFIVKPHPAQSNEVIRAIGDYFRKKNLQHVILDDALFVNTGIESIFSLWKEQVRYVISPVSASLFYLSHLYPSQDIQYLYSYRFTEQHLERAPAQFRNIFLENGPLVKKVFAENCVEMNSGKVL